MLHFPHLYNGDSVVKIKEMKGDNTHKSLEMCPVRIKSLINIIYYDYLY